MEGRDFDYRREGWQHSAAPTYLTSSSRRRRPSCAHRLFEAIMVATCLVVAGASFLLAAVAASDEGSDLAFSNSISFMTGGFLALLAAMTRFGWLLNLSFLPSLWGWLCLDGNGESGGNIVILTYIFDTCVVAIAVGVVVARCRQAQSGVDAYDEEDNDDGYDEEYNDDGIQAHSGPTRGTPMHKEIV
jgi:hypothetical protein